MGGGSFEIGRLRSKEWKNFGRRWTKRVGCPENWTIFLDVICVSSLRIISETCSISFRDGILFKRGQTF